MLALVLFKNRFDGERFLLITLSQVELVGWKSGKLFRKKIIKKNRYHIEQVVHWQWTCSSFTLEVYLGARLRLPFREQRLVPGPFRPQLIRKRGCVSPSVLNTDRNRQLPSFWLHSRQMRCTNFRCVDVAFCPSTHSTHRLSQLGRASSGVCKHPGRAASTINPRWAPCIH